MFALLFLGCVIGLIGAIVVLSRGAKREAGPVPLPLRGQPYGERVATTRAQRPGPAMLQVGVSTQGRISISSPALGRSQPPARPGLPSIALDDCWFAPGKTVQMGPWTIPDGMIFVFGDSTKSLDSDEASVIDTRLPVARPGTAAAQMPYWPRYAEIEPSARAEYLGWLASGRRDPNVQLGCVFLFVYGLERRLLVDAPASAQARAEVRTLVAELDRLLPIYGASASFTGYVGRLRSVASVLYLEEFDFGTITQRAESPGYDRLYPLATQLSVQLARRVRDRKPIGADMALCWWLSVPLNLRTPAVRCWPQFIELFHHRYAEAYPSGLAIEPNRTRLRIPYTPASPSLRAIVREVEPPGGELPDVMRLTRPLRKVAEIIDRCTDELDAYSRWVGRNAGTGSLLKGTPLLPAPLFARAAGAAANGLRQGIERTLRGAQRALVQTNDLLEHWRPEKGTKMSKKEATQFSELLEKLGYGLEPDVRFGGAPLESNSTAVLFRTSEPISAKAPGAIYRGATVLLHIASAVAASDGVVAPEERAAIESQLLAIRGVTVGERSRLAAHVDWLLASEVSLRGIQKRLDALDAGARRAVAAFAVAVAGADGRIDAKEVKALEKIYQALGIPPSEVFEDLHELTTADGPASTPVVVRPAKGGAAGFRIPPAPAPAADGGVRLDMRRVQAKLAESAAVSELLSGIFVEDDEAREDPDERPSLEKIDPAASLPQPGMLDAAHAALARALAARPSWTVSELEDLARTQGLLPDGALDVINEAALDRGGEPAVEGSDPLEVNAQALEGLLR
jgi:hypothetical protein